MAPDEALLWLVHRAAYRVAWWTVRVNAIEPDSLIVTEEREKLVGLERDQKRGDLLSVEKTTSNRAELHIAVRAMVEAEEQLGRYSKLAADAGVDERRVQALERLGSDIAGAFRTLLEGLDLTEAQRKLAPAAVERALRPLELVPGGAA